MKFGVLKDIKIGENRVIATPAEVATICSDGHEVYVQSGSGIKAGFEDSEYEESGAVILESADEIFSTCEFVAKVKEIEESEYGLMREDQIIFTCIHPAAHPEEVDAILEKKVIAFTAEDSHRYGSPNCEAAGKQGALMGLESLQAINGGKGKFVSGLAGAPGIKVLVLGGGIVGKSALQVLHSLGAWCTVADINIGTMREIGKQYDERVNTVLSTKYNIAKLLPEIDIVLNCVKWPKGCKDYLIDRSMLSLMQKGSVIVDISNDEQGAIESFRETTHENPRYIEGGVVHYCVSNIPSLISHSTSIAYAASVLPHFRSIMNNGVQKACEKDGFLRRSLTAYRGYLTHEETSAVQQRPWVKPEEILAISQKELDYAPRATVSRSENYYSDILI